MSDVYKAKKTARQVILKLTKMRKETIRQKYGRELVHDIEYHNWKNVTEKLLSLSSYTDIPFDFIYKSIENPNENKDAVYAFTICLYVFVQVNKKFKLKRKKIRNRINNSVPYLLW